MTALGAKKHDATGRSTGKRKANRRTTIGGQFAPRLIEMLESPAYRALSLSAHRVLSRIEIELAHHGGADNGRLPVTFNHFVEYGVDRHSIGPAIRELEALGFVEVTERGRAGNGEFRAPSLFRLTYRATESASPTDNWRNIEADAEARDIARLARYARCASEKRKTSGGKRTAPVGETPTEKPPAPVGETPTTAPVGDFPTTSISRGNTTNRPVNRSSSCADGDAERLAILNELKATLG